MSTDVKWALISRGVLAGVLGLLCLGRPSITVGVVVILFAVVAGFLALLVPGATAALLSYGFTLLVRVAKADGSSPVVAAGSAS